MIKAKWFIYTVLIGLIPFLIRTFIFLFDKNGTTAYWLNESDFIALGLVLNLTNINELEDKTTVDKLWKTYRVGFSVAALILLSSILAIITYADFKQSTDIDKEMVKRCSIAIAITSLIFSYSIFNRLNKII